MPSYETWCDWRGDRVCLECGGPSAADYCTDCWRDRNSAIGPPLTEASLPDAKRP